MSYIVLPFTDMSKLTVWLWNLSQRQRQADGVARRLQYGQDAPQAVIVLGRVGQADDDLVGPRAVRRGQAGGRAVQDSHPALVAASTQNQALSALLFLCREVPEQDLDSVTL